MWLWQSLWPLVQQRPLAMALLVQSWLTRSWHCAERLLKQHHPGQPTQTDGKGEQKTANSNAPEETTKELTIAVKEARDCLISLATPTSSWEGGCIIRWLDDGDLNGGWDSLSFCRLWRSTSNDDVSCNLPSTVMGTQIHKYQIHKVH